MGQIHHLAPSADTHPCLSDVQCEYGFSLTTAAIDCRLKRIQIFLKLWSIFNLDHIYACLEGIGYLGILPRYGASENIQFIPSG